MPVFTFNNHAPLIDPTAFLAPTAVLSGQVNLGPQVSVWFGAVIRGDIQPITIGPRANVQDNCVIHVRHDGQGVSVGADVCLGHGVILHECIIEEGCLIGMGALILDRARIGRGSIVAAGSVVTPRTIIPPGALALGTPAKPVRDVTDQEQAAIQATVARYIRVAESYKSGTPYEP